MSVKINKISDIQNKIQNTTRIDARLFHAPRPQIERRELEKMIKDAIQADKAVIAIVLG